MTIPARRTAAQGHPCPYCGVTLSGKGQRNTAPTYDHVWPRSRGGRDTIICCYQCNCDKGDLSLDEFAVVLTMRKDPRARFVSVLVAQFASGEVRLSTPNELMSGKHSIGYAPGVFA